MRLPLIAAIILVLGSPATAQSRLDEVPRTAVISAFPAELAALEATTTGKRTSIAGGTAFVTGTLEGKPVVLFLSGVSMVNAAMTTQAALDRFNVTRIVFSGIAGGVDPALDVGDVVVADRWAQYLENAYGREVSPGKFSPPDAEPVVAGIAPFGMMYPRGVLVPRAPRAPERKVWFAVDPAMLAVARGLPGKVDLRRCIADRCLVHAPKLVVGGAGVSGPTFMDNAKFRAYAHQAFGAQVLDMESAAVAHVADANGVPFIAFRSLSDLAGGDDGGNQIRTFFQLAADNSAAVVRAFIAALP